MRPKKIKQIVFGLLSPEEIRKMSALKVITADTYDEDGFPIDMGLMDTHLGVIEPGLRCKTCGRKVDECPGHFGHINLAMPVIHVGYVKLIKNLLKATCRSCGRCLLNDREIEEAKVHLKKCVDTGQYPERDKVFKEVVREATKAKSCPHCGAEQKKISLDKPTTSGKNGTNLRQKRCGNGWKRYRTTIYPFSRSIPR